MLGSVASYTTAQMNKIKIGIPFFGADQTVERLRMSKGSPKLAIALRDRAKHVTTTQQK